MTCKLYNADDRALIVDLLQRYDDEMATIAALKQWDGADYPGTLETNVNGQVYTLTAVELVQVYERRMDDIKNQLMNKGVELAESKPGLASIERHRRVDVGPGGMLNGDPLPVLADIGPH